MALSVRLSVCLSVRKRYCTKTTRQLELVYSNGMEASFLLHGVTPVPPKINVLSSGTLPQLQIKRIVAWQFRSRNVHFVSLARQRGTLSVINWTVVAVDTTASLSH